MMSEIFTKVWSFVVDKWLALDSFLASKGLNLMTLALVLGLIIASILFFRFLIRLRKRNKVTLLVSKGEIRQGRDFKPIISLRLSNLNKIPLQVLEISLDSDSMPMPELVELAELVGPDEVITIESELEQNLVGETGVLHLFAFFPKRANQLYRLRATYSFEPWAGRYKISPFKQTIKKVRQLDSELVSKSKSTPLSQKLLERSRTEIEPITEKSDFKPQRQSPLPAKEAARNTTAKPIKPLIKKRLQPSEKTVAADAEAEVSKPKVKQDLKFPKEF